jgi:indole-3-glycerol phosphate synthase
MFLEKIVALQKEDISRRKTQARLENLKKKIEDLPNPRDFERALCQNGLLALIAEIKRASPSAGLIRERSDIAKMAEEYQRGGACAISIVTEARYFRGDLSFLGMAKEAVPLPVLQKDFVVDPLQIYEGRAAGADSVLLIAAILGREELEELVELVRSLNLFPLVEVHDEEDLEKVSPLRLSTLGINNRNLKTLEVDLGTTERLIPKVSPGVSIISESGIRGRKDVERLERAGVRGILVGETLMRAADPASAVREILNR